MSTLKIFLNNKYVKYSFLIIIFTIFHFGFASFISINGVIPDIFLIFVVWLGIKEDRLFGMIAGFFIGMYMDFVSGDVTGINALTKTVVGFIAGNFHKKDAIKQLTNDYRFIFIVSLCAVAHNLIYFLFFINTDKSDYILLYLRLGLASAFYTTFISAFVYIFQISTKRIKYYS